MLCKNPFMVGIMPCPCGQCDTCRLKRKALWRDRIMLESFKHGYSSFATLTYDEEHCPKTGSLNPKHAQDWLKRLRLLAEPRKIRYYLAGEYGDQTWRPHYHAVLFGLSVADENIVRASWGMGHILLGELTPERAAYVAGYVTKKMSKKEDVRLNGKYPEFQRMSLRPGIGAGAMADVARVVNTPAGRNQLRQNGDVPASLTIGKKYLGLGRYLRRKLRKELGGDGDAPKISKEVFILEMQNLFKENVVLAPYEKAIRKEVFKNKLVDMNKQKASNMVARSKIYGGNKTI